MPFEIQPGLESDYAKIVGVEDRAFRESGPSFMFPGPFPANSAEIRVKEMIQEQKDEPAGQWLKVVDTDAEDPTEPIACAKWYVYNDKLPGPRPSRPWGEGTNPEACNEFFGGMKDKMKTYVGDRHCLFLAVLVTDPKYQRRGAGGMLVKWGIDKADEYGIPAYLEGTDKGRPVYERCGFKVKELYEVDFSRLGATKPEHAWIMLYDPKEEAKT